MSVDRAVWRRARMRILAVTAIAVVAASVAAVGPVQSQERQPTRSGTIIGGYYPFIVVLAPGPGPDCTTNVDCLPWVLAGCPAELTGLDPALHTSIVDVGKIAGSRKQWTLTVESIGPPLLFRGVSVQLWDRACNEILQVGDYTSAISAREHFRIPKAAKWMTVASVDTPPLTWRLQ